MYDGIFRLRRRGPADSGFLIRSPAGRFRPQRSGKGPSRNPGRGRFVYTQGMETLSVPCVRFSTGSVVCVFAEVMSSGRCRSCGGRDISDSGRPSVSGPHPGRRKENPSGRASISFFVLKKSALSDCLRSFSSDILGIFVSKNRLRHRGPGYCPTVAVLFAEYTWDSEYICSLRKL